MYILRTAPRLQQQAIGQRYFTAALKNKVGEKIAATNEVLKEFRKEHADAKVGEVKVGQVLGGMHGILGMVYETSKLHPTLGINYRGHDLFEIMKKCPSVKGGEEPMPEACFWLLLTGEFPNQQEIDEFQAELFKRGQLTADEEKLIKSFPKDMHPTTQFSMGVLACQPRSQFAKAYRDGLHKSKYWEVTYEDSLDVVAKASRIASIVYHNSYGDNTKIPAADPKLDYGANFARMIGFEDPNFWDLTRLYLVLHADHEGGNVSAHASHLVGSALSDPYLSFSAAMNGLAGPLHGLANQECLRYLFDFQAKYGDKWSEKDIADFCHENLKSGKVIPGFGHAVLRQTDPRFICQLEFISRKVKEESNLMKILRGHYKVIPEELGKLGKVKNPWPNVDFGSGTLLTYYGLDKFDFFTVLFGVSRAFGVCSAQVWSRGLGLPIERPNSTTLGHLIAQVKGEK